jgi:hypothetical protein
MKTMSGDKEKGNDPGTRGGMWKNDVTWRYKTNNNGDMMGIYLGYAQESGSDCPCGEVTAHSSDKTRSGSLVKLPNLARNLWIQPTSCSKVLLM